MVKVLTYSYVQQLKDEQVMEMFKTSATLQLPPKVPGKFFFSRIFGETLLDKDSKLVDTKELLEGKYVGLYFGDFTKNCIKYQSKLLNLQNLIRKKHQFEIAYVSCDLTEEIFNENRKNNPFYMIEFAKKDVRVSLSRKFKIKRIPGFVLFDSVGKVLTNNIEWIFYYKNVDHFPWVGEYEREQNDQNCIIN